MTESRPPANATESACINAPEVLNAPALTAWRQRFESCYVDHYIDLVNAARHVLGPDHAAAEDCVQGAFLTVWLNRNRYGNVDPLLSLMRVAVRHAALNARKRIDRACEDWDACADSEPKLAIASTEERVAIEADLLPALFSMPLQPRMAFVHVQVLERTIPETAALMQISEKTLRNHLAIARKHLSTALGVVRRRRVGDVPTGDRRGGAMPL